MPRQTQESEQIVPHTEFAKRPRITLNEIALPPSGVSFDQDAEWCVVRVNREWRRIRFHDYDQIYEVPGLYERLFYDVLQCNSPSTVRELLEQQLHELGILPSSLRVLDLGAGNGMVGEELADMGAAVVVGTDIIPAAAEATERDRPDTYTEYVVADMSNLSTSQNIHLQRYHFNCLACVAALGFGDIPPEAFASAYNLISHDGLVVFNIKDRFLDDRDTSGFAELIQEMEKNAIFSVRDRKRYCHRLATNGRPLPYVAVAGVKRRDIDSDLLGRLGS
jgi:SAM-dependent methyltransferase